MGAHKLRGKDLRKIGYRSTTAISLALEILRQHFKYTSREDRLEVLTEVLKNPEDYRKHPHFQALAALLLPEDEKAPVRTTELNAEAAPYRVYGRKHINGQAIEQLETAMRLPVARQGALMPDAHVGYGLPIGGVLATENAVIPYAVGLDIGCRMCLSVFDARPEYLTRYRHAVKMSLKEHTYFGMKGVYQTPQEDAVLDRPEFRETELLRKLQPKAARQLGTSGSGNHFVEFGALEVQEENALGLEAGKYMALLSHSGSRGLGATVAGFYTRLAMETCRLPREARNLAWLDLDSEAGQEYWRAMNLAGDFAKACHDHIHRNLGKVLGLKALLKVDNHHNFAWEEPKPGGGSWIVHRKGATPANVGTLGIIPGSMTAPGYVVRGKGVADALLSASHGAGRKMSRTKARNSVTGSDMKKMLANTGVTLLGGGTDEAPVAYKNLEQVMASQQDLVSIEGTFYPKIVRMDKA